MRKNLKNSKQLTLTDFLDDDHHRAEKFIGSSSSMKLPYLIEPIWFLILTCTQKHCSFDRRNFKQERSSPDLQRTQGNIHT